jgi:hypothetical protein
MNDIKWIAGYKGLAEAYIKLSVPSVSTILKDMVPDPEMDAWIAEVGIDKVNEILKQAAYRGTVMHKYIETFIKNYFISNTKDINESLKSISNITFDDIPKDKVKIGWELFYKWFNYGHINSFSKFYSSELNIYSKRLYYRGILDLWYNHINYGGIITDFKTASSFVETGSIKEHKHKLQLSGYVIALEEMLNNENNQYKLDAASILLVHTKSDQIQEIILQGEELDKYKSEFETLVKQWHIKNNQEYLIK